MRLMVVNKEMKWSIDSDHNSVHARPEAISAGKKCLGLKNLSPQNCWNNMK